MKVLVSLILVIFLLPACDKGGGESLVYTEAREPCADRNQLRNLYFGDLHAHSGLSFDAWAYGNRATPADTYAFARGEASIGSAQLNRPLDFAALSDHHEFLGEIRMCTTSGEPNHDAETCQDYRTGGMGSTTAFGMELAKSEPARFSDICNPGPEVCLEVAGRVWDEIRAAAEEAYDRSAACRFTSFVAYEYSNSNSVTNLHRNVIFRNAEVPDLPPSYFEQPDPFGLLKELKQTCLEAPGKCDVLSIPHNSNWSNGQLFYPQYPRGEDRREMVALREQMEPLVEIFQHKGDMECENRQAGLGGEEDPFCDFEKQRHPPMEVCGEEPGSGGVSLMGCVHRLDFVRNVLLAGLVEEDKLGINPYRLGIIGSTDTHNGVFGFVDETDFLGHVGSTDDTDQLRLGPGNMTHHGVRHGPGGLAAVWALENSRDAIFEAFRRREVYGTSGTRILVRFFGGWEFPGGLCAADDRVKQGYDRGVPMGAVLPKRRKDAAPHFAVWAEADAVDGAQLDRIQIVKGWMDSGRQTFERVYDVAGPAGIDAHVDLATCQTSGSGADSLCALWKDPDFDPDQPAFYYARVLEVPTCRWSVYQCNRLDPADRPESCSDPVYYRSIRERAWTSPLWYHP